MTGHDPGRKRRVPGVPVKTVVPQDVLDGIYAAAERENRSLSQWIRLAILEKLRAEN